MFDSDFFSGLQSDVLGKPERRRQRRTWENASKDTRSRNKIALNGALARGAAVAVVVMGLGSAANLVTPDGFYAERGVSPGSIQALAGHVEGSHISPAGAGERIMPCQVNPDDDSGEEAVFWSGVADILREEGLDLDATLDVVGNDLIARWGHPPTQGLGVLLDGEV